MSVTVYGHLVAASLKDDAAEVVLSPSVGVEVVHPFWRLSLVDVRMRDRDREAALTLNCR